MVGSAFDGEDVVQEALAKSAEAFAGAGPIERPESWLFRIAHNTALDFLRRRRRHAAMHADADPDAVGDAGAAADARVAAAASLSTFMHLPSTPRSTVVLVDVLGHSLAETADILGVTLATAKAALHRARTRLRELAAENAPPRLASAERDLLRLYADRFNARDFDALRDLLAEDVRLDLVNRRRIDGRKNVGVYFTRYAERSDWRLWPGIAEGRPALLFSNRADGPDAIDYVVLIDWADGKITAIRDFFYAPYVTESLEVRRL
jgi:RNA polymerase sigma-70 factor (ECF subfamily)